MAIRITRRLVALMRSERGSLSVEALLTTVIFTGFALFLLTVMSALYAYEVVGDCLYETATELIAMDYVYERHSDKTNEVDGLPVEDHFRRLLFMENLKGREGFVSDPLIAKTLTILDVRTDLKDEKNVKVITVTYSMVFPMNIMGEKTIGFQRSLAYSPIDHKRLFYDIDEDTTVVFITKTGAKYHKEHCRYLAKSKIPKDIRSVEGRYGPCKVCYGKGVE